MSSWRGADRWWLIPVRNPLRQLSFISVNDRERVRVWVQLIQSVLGLELHYLNTHTQKPFTFSLWSVTASQIRCLQCLRDHFTLIFPLLRLSLNHLCMYITLKTLHPQQPFTPNPTTRSLIVGDRLSCLGVPAHFLGSSFQSPIFPVRTLSHSHLGPPPRAARHLDRLPWNSRT